MDTNTINMNNILIESTFSNELAPNIQYIDSSSTMNLHYPKGLVSSDTLTITLTQL